MFLIDTNIFLEVLLGQENKEACKEFLDANAGNHFISDFSLHSMGVILFKNDKEKIFRTLLDDVITKVKVLTLSRNLYKDLAAVKNESNLDFDDAYQFKLAEEYGLTVITMDKDFKKVTEKVKVIFLNGSDAS